MDQLERTPAFSAELIEAALLTVNTLGYQVSNVVVHIQNVLPSAGICLEVFRTGGITRIFDLCIHFPQCAVREAWK